MFSLRKTYFMIVFILIFSGCTLTNKVIDTKQNNIHKSIKEKDIESKKTQVEKTQVEKNIAKKTKLKKKVFTYKYCDKHINTMNHANKYIQEEFNKGYFIQNDILGAKAQLFLIESNSKSIFAKNINNALRSYNTQYSKAKKNKCDLSKFTISPLKKIELKIEELENNILKEENKK